MREELESGPDASAVALPHAEEAVALPELDASNVIEEAELLLRESAPHDYDVLVIGSGPGGHAAAIRAAQLGAHVGLVEAGEIGGASLNRACLPAHMLRDLARRLGPGVSRADLKELQARKRATIERLRDEWWETLIRHNVELISGRAGFTGKHSVEITSEGGVRRVKAVYIVIATGSTLRRPELPGADLPGVVSVEQLLNLEIIPEEAVIIGGGAAGLEIACLLNALGARCTFLSESTPLAAEEDAELASAALEMLQQRSLRIESGADLRAIASHDGRLTVRYAQQRPEGERESTMAAGLVVLAGVREADTSGLGLDRAGIAHREGRILVDEQLQTSTTGVYAVGDCVHEEGTAQLAAAEGVLAAEHLMRQPETVDLKQIPRCWCLGTEVAAIGLTEAQAREQGLKAVSGKAYFRDCHYSAGRGHEDGWVKMVVDIDSRRIDGCQIIGEGAPELINQVAGMMKAAMTVDEVAGMIFAHPSPGEILPKAAQAALRAA